ncbi:MAG: hypothetical protein AAB370_11935 [Verrucomicrobiota bacterium]
MKSKSAPLASAFLQLLAYRERWRARNGMVAIELGAIGMPRENAGSRGAGPHHDSARGIFRRSPEQMGRCDS